MAGCYLLEPTNGSYFHVSPTGLLAVTPSGKLPRSFKLSESTETLHIVDAPTSTNYFFSLESCQRYKLSCAVDLPSGEKRNIPFPRFKKSQMAGTVFNGELLLIGGYSSGYESTCEKINTQDFSSGWRAMQPLNIPRGFASACVSVNYVYVTGGTSRRGFLSSIERLERGLWVLLQVQLPEVIMQHSSYCVNDKTVLVLGGKRTGASETNKVNFIDLVRYRTGELRSLAVGGRVTSAVTVTDEGKILFFIENCQNVPDNAEHFRTTRNSSLVSYSAQKETLSSRLLAIMIRLKSKRLKVV